MIVPRCRTLFASVIANVILCPGGAFAQDASRADVPDSTRDPQDARSTGLPAPVKWTFNFDAGWGTFGFANSLFINPKDPGTDENLSDQWFEGYVKPALSASHTSPNT